MDLGKKIIIMTCSIYLIASSLTVFADDIDCPPSVGCGPCGETITNLPMPSYEKCGVQPFQSYLATSLNCLRSSWNGFYVGSGFGYGAINYNLNIPGIDFEKSRNKRRGDTVSGKVSSAFSSQNIDFTRSYIIEYFNLGYAFSRNRFFLATELGYYYHSVVSPVFYDDSSTFILNIPASLLTIQSTTLTAPCNVRLDINAKNHVALDLLPGFVLTPRITIFGRVGVEYTGYTWLRRICYPQTFAVTTGPPNEIFVDVNNPVITSTIFNNVFGDVNDNESDGAIDLRLGLGAAFSAGAHLNFTVNAVHIFGGKGTFTPNTALITQNVPLVIGNFGIPVIGTLAGNTSTLFAANTIDPSRNEVTIGMMVVF